MAKGAAVLQTLRQDTLEAAPSRWRDRVSPYHSCARSATSVGRRSTEPTKFSLAVQRIPLSAELEHSPDR